MPETISAIWQKMKQFETRQVDSQCESEKKGNMIIAKGRKEQSRRGEC